MVQRSLRALPKLVYPACLAGTTASIRSYLEILCQQPKNRFSPTYGWSYALGESESDNHSRTIDFLHLHFCFLQYVYLAVTASQELRNPFSPFLAVIERNFPKELHAKMSLISNVDCIIRRRLCERLAIQAMAYNSNKCD